MRNRRRNWFLRRLVLGLAIAAVVAPTAQARIDDSFVGTAKADAPSAVVTDESRRIQPAATFESVVVTDESRRIQPAPKSEPNVVATDESRRIQAVPRGGAVAPTQVTAKPDGFDWGDAGIGAGVLFGLVLLGTGALLAARHLGRPATA